MHCPRTKRNDVLLKTFEVHASRTRPPPRIVNRFGRSVGDLPATSVVNVSHMSYAGLAADEACRNGTRLIYFMNPGQILSRSFTWKDTHTPQGSLIVSYTDEEPLEPSSSRVMSTAALLGFQAPCFTCAGDLILPVEAIGHLRKFLLSTVEKTPGGRRQADADKTEDDFIQRFLASVVEQQGIMIDIPQVIILDGPPIDLRMVHSCSASI